MRHIGIWLWLCAIAKQLVAIIMEPRNSQTLNSGRFQFTMSSAVVMIM